MLTAGVAANGQFFDGIAFCSKKQNTAGVSAAWMKVAGIALLLVAFVHLVLTWKGAEEGMTWIESYKVDFWIPHFGLISFLDFCGSAVTCFNYRCLSLSLILSLSFSLSHFLSLIFSLSLSLILSLSFSLSLSLSLSNVHTHLILSLAFSLSLSLSLILSRALSLIHTYTHTHTPTPTHVLSLRTRTRTQ